MVERFQRAGFDIAPRLARFDFSAFYYSAPISLLQLPLPASLRIFPNPLRSTARSVQIRMDANTLAAAAAENLRFDWYSLDGRWLAGGTVPAFANEQAEIPTPLSTAKQAQMLLKISSRSQVLAAQILLCE
jgi:hypothetical protein